MNVLVTGASGFVGSALISHLLKSDAISSIRAVVRRDDAASASQDRLQYINTGNLSAQTDWSAALAGIDVIAH